LLQAFQPALSTITRSGVPWIHGLCHRCAASPGTCAQDLQATCVVQRTVSPTPCYAKQGRLSPGTSPAQIVSQLAGVLAMRLAARQARIDQHSCFILATNELDDPL
jgi:hypothetical protein